MSNEYTERVSRSGTSTRVEITHAPTDGGWKGVHLRMLDHRELVQDFAFHPSGSLVVAGVTTVKIWNPHDGKLERTLPGDDFTLSDDGRWLFVSSPRDAAIYEWSTMRLVGRWAGSLRAIAVSPTERFAVLHEVVKSPATLNHYVVAIRVMDLKSRRARIVRDANEVGFAFSPDDRWFALAPVASLEISMGPQLAYGIVLHDLATGKVASMLRVQGGGERPFFAKGSDVVGYHTPGGLRLVRRADQRTVDVGAFEKDGKCGIFAVDSAGGFEGEPRGALGFRLGSDLRTSEVVVSGPAFEAQRRRDLVGELLDGK